MKNYKSFLIYICEICVICERQFYGVISNKPVKDIKAQMTPDLQCFYLENTVILSKLL